MPISNDAAISRAAAISGFSDGIQGKKTASLVSSPGQLVPYIKAPGSVWKVTFDDVNVVLPDGRHSRTNEFVKSLDLYLASDTGQIIKFTSEWPKGISGRRFPTVQWEEKQMQRVIQKFISLPSIPPKISLLDALKRSPGAITAKQIVGYYVELSVIDSKAERKPRPVWVIHTWGIPPFMPSYGRPEDVPEDARNHLRTILDAETGEFYSTDNIPQPGGD